MDNDNRINEIATLEYPMGNLISYLNRGENLLTRNEYLVK